MFYLFYLIRNKKKEGRKEQRKGKRKVEFINQ